MTTDDTDNPVRTTRGNADDSGTSGVPTARRRALLAAVAVLVVAAVVALVVVLAGGDGDGRAAAVAGPSTPAETTDAGAPPSEPAESAEPAAPDEGQEPAAAEPAPAEATQDAGELPPALPAVSLDTPVTVPDGLVVGLPRIEAIEGVGQGPGNVAGPALRVTVRIENTSGASVPLDGVTVNAYHGSGLTPASPLEDPSRQPFAGDLPGGEAAEGVYVFRVPSDARDAVTVELTHRADAPRVLFAGPVG